MLEHSLTVDLSNPLTSVPVIKLDECNVFLQTDTIDVENIFGRHIDKLVSPSASISTIVKEPRVDFLAFLGYRIRQHLGRFRLFIGMLRS